MDLLDSGQLASLYDLAGPEMAEMLEEFGQSSRDSFRKLEAAVLEGDSSVGVEIAHELKGGAATLGLAALRDGLDVVEQTLRDGGTADPAEIKGFEGLMDESLEAMRGFLAR